MSFPGGSELLGEALIFGIAFGCDCFATRLLGSGCTLLLGLAVGSGNRFCREAGLFCGLRFGNAAGLGALAFLVEATRFLGRFSERLGSGELLCAALFLCDALRLALPGERLLAGGCLSRGELAAFFRRLCFGSCSRVCGSLRFGSGFSFGGSALSLGFHTRCGGPVFLLGAALGIGVRGKPCLSFIGRCFCGALRFERFATRVGFAAGAGEHVRLIGLHAVFHRAMLGGIHLALFDVGLLLRFRGSTQLGFPGGPVGLCRKFLGNGVTISGLCRYMCRLQTQAARNRNSQSHS